MGSGSPDLSVRGEGSISDNGLLSATQQQSLLYGGVLLQSVQTIRSPTENHKPCWAKPLPASAKHTMRTKKDVDSTVVGIPGLCND